MLTDRGEDLAHSARTTTEYVFMPRLTGTNPDPKPWALAFFLLFTATVLVVWWLRFAGTGDSRSSRSPAVGEALAFQLYGATMLLTQVHENHAYGAAALLAAIWWVYSPKGGSDRELFAIACALCAVVTLNMVLFYGLGQEIGPQIIPRDILGIDLTVLLSIANIGLFGWWLYRWLRPPGLFRLPAR